MDAAFWYTRQYDAAGFKIDVVGRFSFNHGTSWGPLERITSLSSNVPKLSPQNGDPSRRPCDFPGRISSVFPGSGAYVVWGDGRDKGPAANNGVDPNIYFAHVPIPTTTSAVVTKAGTTARVAGAVVPKVPGGKVTATLYRKVSGKFAKVTSQAATLDAAGKYSLSFTRTAAGSCEFIVKFAGSTEYLTSSVTTAFAC